MKIPRPSLCLGLAVLAAMTGPGRAAAPVMRAQLTSEQLVELQRQAERSDPMKTQPVAKTGKPTVAPPVPDLISQSDVLSFQGMAALVPKRAILQIPKNYRDRVAYQPGAKLVGWAEFYAANRGWITVVEINQKQAVGKLALPDETHKLMAKSGNLVVATFFGCPVSLLPFKEPASTESKKPGQAEQAEKPVDAGAPPPSTPATTQP